MITAMLLFAVMLGCRSHLKLHPVEKNEILALLKIERKAHFEKNADLFISLFADTILSVNKGEVKQQSKQEIKTRLQHYFDAVEFVKWDDVAEPLIQFSDDGSLAYATVEKEVITIENSNPRTNKQDTTIYAWVSIYRKFGNDWKLVSNISTNK